VKWALEGFPSSWPYCSFRKSSENLQKIFRKSSSNPDVWFLSEVINSHRKGCYTGLVQIELG
jgi:hypothetical protein